MRLLSTVACWGCLLGLLGLLAPQGLLRPADAQDRIVLRCRAFFPGPPCLLWVSVVGALPPPCPGRMHECRAHKRLPAGPHCPCSNPSTTTPHDFHIIYY